MSYLDQKINVDYYQILGIKNNASIQQICKSYRDLALSYHPSLQHENPNRAYQKFAQIAEAFDVLYDPEKKKIYDQYGEQRLKQGVLVDSNLIGKYKFMTDPEQVFQKFFGTKNVFQHLLDIGKDSNQSHPIFKAQYNSLNNEYQVANLVVPVHCTLTQLFNGCTKQLTYDKKVLTKDGKNAQFIKQTKSIIINPGDGHNFPLVFPEQGNSEPGYKQSMLIFKIVEILQKNFKRDGSNLIYTSKISLIEALDAKSITVTQLNGQLLHLHFDEIITPQTRRVITGKGMPLRQDQSKRGDLIVKFDIQFPQQLEYAKKKRIVQLLKNNS